jgi:hypothetical protein
MSIFKEYYSNQSFTDRFITNPEGAIDVIIPVYHTNELWHANLISIFREVPVRRLLISDGGVIDDSIAIVNRFPRVEVLNHRNFKSLGKCISELIAAVTSEWFIYLHSDVYLPPGWFDTMTRYQDQYDWYGCPMNITVLTQYRLEEPLRPYAGSQIGRKAAFEKGISLIDDDYVYRQEDFVFNRIVEDAGYKTGKVEDTFHYHQIMFRKSNGYDLNIKRVQFISDTKESEKKRINETQIKGIVKYLDPIEPYVINDFKSIATLMLLNRQIDYKGFRSWIKSTNPHWLIYFDTSLLLRIYYYNNKTKFFSFLRRVKKAIF